MFQEHMDILNNAFNFNIVAFYLVLVLILIFCFFSLKYFSDFVFLLIYFFIFLFFTILFFYSLHFFFWYSIIPFTMLLISFFMKMNLMQSSMSLYLIRKYVFPLMAKYVSPLMAKYVSPFVVNYVFPMMKFVFYYFLLFFFSIYFVCLLFTLILMMLMFFFIFWFSFLFVIDNYLFVLDDLPINHQLSLVFGEILFFSLFYFSFFYMILWSYYFDVISGKMNNIFKKTNNTFIFFMVFYFEKFWIFFMFMFWLNMNGILMYVNMLQHPFFEIKTNIILFNFCFLMLFNFFYLLVFLSGYYYCKKNLMDIKDMSAYSSDIFFFSNEEDPFFGNDCPHFYYFQVFFSFLIMLRDKFISENFLKDFELGVKTWYYKNEKLLIFYSCISLFLVLNFILMLFLFWYTVPTF